MRTTRHPAIHYALITVACLVIIYAFFPYILTEPNGIMFDMGSDGYKNYFTFAWHLKHGSGLKFEGMLYPYGEHIVYADAQFPVLFFFKGLSAIFPGLANQGVGLIHIAMLAGIIIGAIFIYRILKLYRTDDWLAVLFAILIAFGSPQLFRMPIHHALSYVFIYPVLFYFILKYVKTERKANVFVYAALAFLFSLIHVYHLFAVSLCLGFFWLIRTIQLKKINWVLLIAILIPNALFMGFMALTDPYSDRPSFPTGIEGHKALFEDMFLPLGGPFSRFLEFIGIPTPDIYTEGYAYIGIVSISVLLYQLVLLIRNYYLSPGKRALRTLATPELTALFFSGVFVFCYAMYIPFIWIGGEVLDYLPFVKQFRGIGRLTWIFYYVVCIYSTVVVSNYLKLYHKKRLYKNYGVLFLSLVWASSIVGNLNYIKEGIQKYGGENDLVTNRDINNILHTHSLNAGQFQAVVSMPMSTLGNEVLYYRPSWFTKHAVWPFAWQTGLPTTDIDLSRVSYNRSMQVFQLSGRSYVPKPILQDMTSDKPFLIVIKKERKDDFADFLTGADIIDSTEHLLICSLEKYDLQYAFRKDSIDTILNSWFKADSTTYLSAPGGDVWQLYNNQVKKVKAGGQASDLVDMGVAMDTTSAFELSLWYLPLIHNPFSIPVIEIRVKDENGEILHAASFREWDLPRVEYYNGWIGYTMPVPIDTSARRIQISTAGKHYMIRDLLLRPSDVNVFRVRGAYYLLNDLVIDPESVE